MSEPEQGSQPASTWIIPDTAHLESLAEFAAGAGHEINNPLATIIGRAQQLLKDERDTQRRQMLQSIGAQAYRVRDMIGDAMLFGRPPKPELQEVSLLAIVEEVVKRQADQTAAALCTVELQISPEITLSADPTQLSIVISELLRNSRQALQPAGDPIQIRAAQLESEIQIEFLDHGRGFTEAERIHAFDPFFSGRQAGRGLGFGLPKCWQIVRQHGGRIEIESRDGGPTVARVFWPNMQSDRLED
ncbi:MAG: HAMP domain-containing histidine kinase [Planctomycetes bacterium]|nr:HAMP domain-containing histidine kinase [Planctomycetota bacterium]